MSDRSQEPDVDLDDATDAGVRDPSEASDRPPAGPVPEEDSPEPADSPEGTPSAGPGPSFPPGHPPAGSSPGDSAARARADDGDGGPGSVDEAEQAVVDDLAKLGELEKERDDYLDALRRLQADFDNFRKRMVRQQTETLERAAEDLVAKLLPVLDAVDLARQHGGGEAVDQIAAALFDVLTKEGLERLGEEGEPFDPNLHEAVAHEDGDGTDPRIAQVMRPGYRWRQRLLRAAMVTVKG